MAATPALAALHLLVVGDGDLRDELRRAGGSTRAVGARALSRRAPRSRRSAGGDRCLRDAVAVGRAAAVDGARDGRRPAGRRDRGRRHSRSRARTARPACSCRRPTSPALGAALARLVSDPALRQTLGAAAAAFVLPRFGVDGYVDAVTGLYDRLLAEADAREARHRLSHAVLARRRRHAARDRRIVRAVRRFAGAVLRRDLAVRAGPLRAARRGHADSGDQRHARAAAATSTARCSSIRSCRSWCRASCGSSATSISCTAACRRRRRSSRRVCARLFAPSSVPARRRRSAGAAADDAVSRAEAAAVARLHGVRRAEHPVDGESRADVRQRRGADAEALAPTATP